MTSFLYHVNTEKTLNAGMRIRKQEKEWKRGVGEVQHVSRV